VLVTPMLRPVGTAQAVTTSCQRSIQYFFDVHIKSGITSYSFCLCFNVQNDVGWRNQSRKIIVISTDAEFHIAGDGLVSCFISTKCVAGL